MPDDVSADPQTKCERQRQRAEERRVAEDHDKRPNGRAALWTVALIALGSDAEAADEPYDHVEEGH